MSEGDIPHPYVCIGDSGISVYKIVSRVSNVP